MKIFHYGSSWDDWNPHYNLLEISLNVGWILFKVELQIKNVNLFQIEIDFTNKKYWKTHLYLMGFYVGVVSPKFYY
jgi:hypothetical protein